MKIRLYRGPLNGKVMEGSFNSEAIILGPKKMSREALWKYQSNMQPSDPRHPMVRCLYRKVVVSGITHSAVGDGMVFSDIACMHPDGSYFYEYVKIIAEYP